MVTHNELIVICLSHCLAALCHSRAESFTTTCLASQAPFQPIELNIYYEEFSTFVVNTRQQLSKVGLNFEILKSSI